jgi:hypothetical protein
MILKTDRLVAIEPAAARLNAKFLDAARSGRLNDVRLRYPPTTPDHALAALKA